MSNYDLLDIESIIGTTFVSVDAPNRDKIKFVTDDGRTLALMHREDCCEYVILEDICGDLADLVGSPITMAEEATNSTDPPGVDGSDGTPRTPESYTWTFYRIGTTKGSVTIRFYGESNGYYSETASLYEVTE